MEIKKKIGDRIVYSTDINLLFPGWREKDEKIIALSPHDDDVLIGAGLLICKLRNLDVDVHVAIISDGKRGYCEIEQKESIVEIRKKETENAYAFIRIDSEHIKRFELPDSDLYKHAFSYDDLISPLIKYFREKGATRFLLPNENDFHLDHKATFEAGLYSAIQASEKIVPDLGEHCRRDTILRYGVWSPFSENPTQGIKTSKETLERKLQGLSAYKSQELIIEAMKKRGEYEFFQEFVVTGYPLEKYRKEMFGQ